MLSAVIKMFLFVAQAVARIYIQHGDYNENKGSRNKNEIEHPCLPWTLGDHPPTLRVRRHGGPVCDFDHSVRRRLIVG